MIYLSKEGMYAKIKQKMETLGTFFVLMFFAAGATVHTTATDVQAATKNGFKTEKDGKVLLLSEWTEGKRPDLH